MIKNLFIILILVSSSVFGDAVVRAALDVGSGGIKVTVAKVIDEAIEHVYYAHEYAVPFKRDMETSKNNSFSEEVQRLALQTFAQIKKDVACYEPVEFSGIATAASRKAKNAQALYDKVKQDFDINIEIISQAEEGRLGFMTAEAISKISQGTLVCYDSGMGSFQFTTQINQKLEVVEGDVAYIYALTTLVEDLRKHKLDTKSSPNPVTLEEASALVPLLQKNLPHISSVFAEKLKSPQTNIVGIGNQNFIFSIASVGTGKKSYTKEEVWKAIVDNCNKSDEQLGQFYDPNTVLVGMILLYSVMDAYEMPRLTYVPTNGSCEGVLIDARYWSTSVISQAA